MPFLVSVLLVAGLTLTGLYAWHDLRTGDGSGSIDRLLDQMRAAAGGVIANPHAFGGTLSVAQSEGRINVIAANLPPRACVQVGWQLVREGTVIVNGVLPPRISAAKLSELCNLNPEGATLLWAPQR
jgi:hypothetical protein